MIYSSFKDTISESPIVSPVRLSGELLSRRRPGGLAGNLDELFLRKPALLRGESVGTPSTPGGKMNAGASFRLASGGNASSTPSLSGLSPRSARKARNSKLEPLAVSPNETDADARSRFIYRNPSLPCDRGAHLGGGAGCFRSSSRGSDASTPSTALSHNRTPSSCISMSTPSTRSSCCIGTIGGCAMNPVVNGWRQGVEIGSGSYGRVYKAQDKSMGQIFAVKIVRMDGDEKLCETMKRELDVCKELRHKHIVTYLGHEYCAKTMSMHIFMEYVAGGTLRHMLNEFGALEGRLLKKASRGVLKGLKYLHTHEPPIVHRDLKGSNVLVDLNYTVKLADFGCSKCDVNTQTFTTHGSVLFMAPEVLQGSGSGRMADIWSFGCVVIEMLTASDPWGEGAFSNRMQAMYTIAASDRIPPFPENVSTAAREMLSACLRRDPDERLAATQLLKFDLVHDSSGGTSRVGSRPSTREAC